MSKRCARDSEPCDFQFPSSCSDLDAYRVVPDRLQCSLARLDHRLTYPYANCIDFYPVANDGAKGKYSQPAPDRQSKRGGSYSDVSTPAAQPHFHTSR